jgi:sodium-dependent dicarboxylate transporter 2/3/5
MGLLLAEQAAGLSVTGVYFFSAATSMMFSELTSNLVSISVIVPLMPTLANSTGAIPLETAMVATFAGVYGFMLPISTSANAIVYASGQVPFWKMAKTGFLVDISGIFIVVLGLHIMLPLVGLT